MLQAVWTISKNYSKYDFIFDSEFIHSLLNVLFEPQVSFEVSADLTDELLVSERKRHQAYLMVDRGTILGSPEAITNLPKQQLSRLKRIFSSFFSNFFRAMFGCMISPHPDHRRSYVVELKNYH